MGRRCPDCDLPTDHVGACVTVEATFVADRIIIDLTPEVLAMACEGCGAVGTLFIIAAPDEATAECSKCKRKIAVDRPTTEPPESRSGGGA